MESDPRGRATYARRSRLGRSNVAVVTRLSAASVLPGSTVKGLPLTKDTLVVLMPMTEVESNSSSTAFAISSLSCVKFCSRLKEASFCTATAESKAAASCFLPKIEPSHSDQLSR